MKLEFGGDWARLEKPGKMGSKAGNIHKLTGPQRARESLTQPVRSIDEPSWNVLNKGTFLNSLKGDISK